MGTGVRGKRPGASKSVPYFSHEFIIQNHGDIATCICMVFVVGLMFQTSAPLASTFIAPKHNITDMDQAKTPGAAVPNLPILYTYGLKDICLVFFYTITVIIAHAVIQEYILDKWMRKVKLSKTKASKFNESGQLVVFYILSAIWAGIIFRDDGYFQSLSFFWTGYPHIGLTFLTKFFFIIQMSYWLHLFPELYFQKVKREDIASKILFAVINFSICLAIYLLNLTRIGLTLLFIDYSISALFHVSRILYFSGKNNISKLCFNIYNVLFVLARLTAAILSIFVFWFGLATSSIENIKLEEKNFNTPLIRTLSLSTILLLQGWMLWNFILFQCKKIRENSKPSSTPKPVNKPLTRKAKASKEELSDTEVDRDLKETNGDVKKKSD
jgi:translocating chain-associated membrane protein 1